MLHCSASCHAQSCPLVSCHWLGEEHETIFGTELLGNAARMDV